VRCVPAISWHDGQASHGPAYQALAERIGLRVPAA